MLHSVKDLEHGVVHGRDSEIGQVIAFYFDERSWRVRYLVADTAAWWAGKQVLIPTERLRQPDRRAKIFPVDLTKDAIRTSPDVVAEPRQMANDDRYAWPILTSLLGNGYAFTMPPVVPIPAFDDEDDQPREEDDRRPRQEETTLRSSTEIIGCHIEARDGRSGHLNDLLIDDHDWTVRYLVIGLRDWLPGKHVLVTPQWTSEIRWEGGVIRLELTKREIETSPEHHGVLAVDREYEIRLG